ncbi:MAG: wax ester/triacylglycerol synthase family O-acyltransferase [Desulfosalsimonadaceae bacterium]
MSGIDNLMLALNQPGPPPVITGCFEFEGRLDLNRVSALVEKRLLCHDRFSMLPSRRTGRGTWARHKTVDLTYHLCRTPLSPPGGKKQLRKLFSELSADPLDPERPLWRIHYIENIGSGGSILFFRIHHCIADGMALVNLLLSITENESGTTESRLNGKHPVGRNPASGRRQCHKACDFAKRKIKSIARDPVHARKCAGKMRTALSETAMTIARVLMLPPDRHYFSATPPGNHREMAWSAPLPLDEIKKTGARFNATVNDVIVALIAGGIRRHLRKRCDLESMPPLRMAVPVNIRPAGTDREPGIELKNEFGFVLAPLPVSIKDPVRRIRRVHAILEKLKQSSDPSAAWAGMNALGAAPAEVAVKTAHLFAEKITGIISNVPGPDRPLHFAGGKLKGIRFWLPLIKGMGIGVSAFSYNNAVSLGIVTDAGMVPDPDAIARHIEEEFKAILKKKAD